jgi:hypothetical protein
MYAWITQQARTASGNPVRSAKVRFRAALLPGEQASIATVVDGASVKCELTRGDDLLVTGTVITDGEG